MGKIMFVGAHPDDETFMCGATLAKYAHEGHKIKVVTATKGEAGQWSDIPPAPGKLGEIRTAEHRKGLEILGISDLVYLDFIDGTLSNQNVVELTDKVAEIAEEYKPDFLIAPDLNGISGHVDHIVMALVAAYVYRKVETINKLYYYVLPSDGTENYRGRKKEEITTFVDVEKWIQTKIEAAQYHETQKRDTEYLIPYWKEEKTEHFMLGGSRVKTKLPETDLFEGI